MKYIVYKTTNKINKYIYIGVHKTIDPNVFDGYIGCGVNIHNSATYNNPKTNFQIAVKEFGPKNFIRETIAIFDNEEEASNLEMELVNYEFLARADVYNMVLGGYFNVSNSIKVYQYDNSGTFIQEFSSYKEAADACKRSISMIYKSIIFKTKCAEFYYNTDKVNKLDLSNYNKVKPIKVYRYLVNGGSLDKEYDSLSSAASDSNLTLIQVARSARIGYRAGIYQFCFVKANSYDKAKLIYIKNRQVYKYSSDGKFICGYSSQYEAEQDNLYSDITKSIKNKKPCQNNFLWSLEELPEFCSTKSKKKPVGKFDKNGNLLQSWESVKACVAETKITKAYITHEKFYKGFLYKHI